MRIKGLLMIALLAIVGVFLVFTTPVLAKDKVITWKMAGVWGPGDGAYPPETCAKEITENSGGKLKVNVYPGGQLYGSQEIFGALQKGLIQMCEIPLGYWGGAVPVYKVGEIPFLIRDNKDFKAYLDAGLYNLWEKAGEKVGLKLLGVTGWNDLQCYSRFPIRTLDDVKGRKWRVYTPPMAEAVRALGASPVSMGAPEVYQAMQRGVVDACFGGVTWGYSFKWHEVGPHVVKMDFAMPPTCVFANKKAFDALPEDLKKVVINAGKNYANWDIIEGFTKKKYEQFKEAGSDIYILPEDERNKLMKKCKPIWDKVAGDIGPEGKEALEIYYKLFPERR